MYNFIILYQQEENIPKICNKLVEVTQEECPELINEAIDIREKYKQLFRLFGVCHRKYNASAPMEEQQIAVLGTST